MKISNKVTREHPWQSVISIKLQRWEDFARKPNNLEEHFALISKGKYFYDAIEGHKPTLKYVFFFHDGRWSFTINVLKYPSFAHFLVSFTCTLFQSPAFYKQQLVATCWENLDLHGREYNLTEASTRSVIFTRATPTQVLSRKFCKIFKKTYFTEHLRATFTSSKSFVLDP